MADYATGSIGLGTLQTNNHPITINLLTAIAIPPSAPAGPSAEIDLILRKVSYYSRLNRIISYLNNDIGAALDLEKAAEIACMERTSFSRFFKRVAGITFREFLQRWRIAIAIQLLAASDDSILQIALAIGFNSISAFERTFRKITALSPSVYRRQLLGELLPACPANER